MQYDDRLATVLRPKVTGAGSARIQYQQLLDLLGTISDDTRGGLVDSAYRRLAQISALLPVADRVAMLAEPALRLRSPRLVAALAATDAPVASAAVQAASLSGAQWLDLIPALAPAARAAMRDRLDIGAGARNLLARLGVGNRALPPTDDTGAASTSGAVSQPPLPERGPADNTPAEGIGAIVRRIEAFRRARSEAGPEAIPGDSPRLPLGEDRNGTVPDIHSFDFMSDVAARITWSEARVAPMVVGIDLSQFQSLNKAFAGHQRVRAADVALTGAPAIAGPWTVDAAPRFAPLGGRFLGHIGRFRRLSTSSQAADDANPGDTAADRLRQLLHELRTPVNAIQGFAEIIQQQLFGPTPHEYRALAAVIAADSARMLAGFEELERFARLEGRELDLTPGESDLAACVSATVERLAVHIAPRGSGFALAAPDGRLPLAIAAIETERLCWRLLATLAANARAGEALHLQLRQNGNHAQLTMQLPAVLAGLDDATLFHAATDNGDQVLSTGMFGTGFALRLAASEARAAGGRLDREQGNLNLFLPISPAAAPTIVVESRAD